MSKLFIVCGLGGSGKTTIARALSQRLNLVCFFKDTIKEALHDQLGLVTRDSYKLYHRLVEEQVANGVDIMMELTFAFEPDVEMLKEWMERYDLEIINIVCRVDDETRRKRITTRGRHVCHEEGDAEALKNLDQVFDYSRLPGRKIMATTDRETQEVIKEVLQQLEA